MKTWLKRIIVIALLAVAAKYLWDCLLYTSDAADDTSEV